MQRRQLLKLILPLTLLSAGVVGVVLGRKLLLEPGCTPSDQAALLARLQPFADAELGKSAGPALTREPLDRLAALCEPDFDQHYRHLVQDDFASGRIQKLEGWIVSQTEALTHRVVYLHQASLSGGPPAGG